jgi:hypothetical protein
MTAQSIVCGSCSNEVPYGRLSCPSCGELLASVSGSRRSPSTMAARSAVPDVLYDAGEAPTAAVVHGPLAREAAPRDPEAELPWAASTTHGARDAGYPHDADAAAGDVAAGSDGWDAAAGAADDDGVDVASINGLDRASSTAGPAWAVGTAGLGAAKTPSYMPRPVRAAPAALVSDPVASQDVASAYVASPSFADPPVPSPSFAGPGSYVPPMPVTMPAGPPAPAREWAGHPPTPEGRLDDGAGPAAAAAPADRQARFAEFVGWLSVAGAAFGAVGFLLPWGMVVIGSSGVGYFDRWGLSGPGHLIVALAMLAILGLALVKNIIPVWIRTGLIGLGVGAYLLGLVWPYVFALPGTGPGAVIAAIGAVALTVAGLLALVNDRHGRVDRPV